MWEAKLVEFERLIPQLQNADGSLNHQMVRRLSDLGREMCATGYPVERLLEMNYPGVSRKNKDDFQYALIDKVKRNVSYEVPQVPAPATFTWGQGNKADSEPAPEIIVSAPAPLGFWSRVHAEWFILPGLYVILIFLADMLLDQTAVVLTAAGVAPIFMLLCLVGLIFKKYRQDFKDIFKILIILWPCFTVGTIVTAITPRAYAGLIAGVGVFLLIIFFIGLWRRRNR